MMITMLNIHWSYTISIMIALKLHFILGSIYILGFSNSKININSNFLKIGIDEHLMVHINLSILYVFVHYKLLTIQDGLSNIIKEALYKSKQVRIY